MSENLHWFKGNTHTHTTLSDGDASPDDVIRWYAENGYGFLAITDHGVYAPPEDFDGHGLTLIGGTELGGLAQKPVWIMNERQETTPIHAVGLGVSQHLESFSADTVLQTIQMNVDSIGQTGAVPVMSHPNYWWAFGDREMTQVTGCDHFELVNQHPACFPYGDEEHASVEIFWDRCLSAGRKLYGLAADDAHQYQQWGPGYANPGKGWIVARSASSSPGDILRAIRSGDFYASTGVALVEYTVTESRILVGVDETTTPDGFEVLFIGLDGEIQFAGSSNPIEYEFRGDEVYVRAKVKATAGSYAWTQPVFLEA